MVLLDGKLITEVDISTWPEPTEAPLPKCKYSSMCDLLGNDPTHMKKFSHVCWYIHPGDPVVAPGTKWPITKGTGGPTNCACAPPSAKHLFYFCHPCDAPTLADEEVDESTDELDAKVLPAEELDTPPDTVALRSNEPSEAEMEAAMEAKGAAQAAMGEGDFETAVTQFTVAISAMPSAIALANRGTAYLKLRKPRSALADCEAAIALNPDSAKAYKVAAKALCLVGDFDEAFSKLCVGNGIDGDDDSMELQQQLKAKLAKKKKNAAILEARAEQVAEA